MLDFKPIDLDDPASLSQAICFRRDSFVCSFGDDQMFDETQYVGFLKDTFARDPQLAVHVFREGALVGQLELGVTRGTPWLGYVNLYYLTPAARGTGLGAALDAHVTRMLLARGFARARLRVSISNARARRFYARQGWREVPSTPADRDDLLVLEKELAPPVLAAATLETPRLWLRALSDLDVPSYERHFVDYEVIRFLARKVPWPFPAGGVASHFRTLRAGAPGSERWLWGLFRKEAPLECIGAVDLFRPGRPNNRGFWLGRPFWGQGFMTEATAAVTDYAFADLGFEELVLSNARGNLRSRRIKERTPATFLRTQPGEYVDPAFTETELWRLERSAWSRNSLGQFEQLPNGPASGH